MILFLDFDGTTHPEPAPSGDAFCQLPLIEGVLREFPAVEVVISSAWRLWLKDESIALARLRTHFSEHLRARLVGVTPDHHELDRDAAPDDMAVYPREWECVTWLRKNRTSWTPWLALDDRIWLFRPFCPHLMAVDCEDGFMRSNVDEFRRRLSELGGMK